MRRKVARPARALQAGAAARTCQPFAGLDQRAPRILLAERRTRPAISGNFLAMALLAVLIPWPNIAPGVAPTGCIQKAFRSCSPRQTSLVFDGALPANIRLRRQKPQGTYSDADQTVVPMVRRFSSAVEQRFCKPKVGSSILSTGTIKSSRLLEIERSIPAHSPYLSVTLQLLMRKILLEAGPDSAC